MREVVPAMLTGVVAFVTTNVDDIFVLMLFFAQRSQTFRVRHIVIGQYLGFGALVAITALGFVGTLVVPRALIGVLGLVPIALGVRQLLKQRTAQRDLPVTPARQGVRFLPCRSPFWADWSTPKSTTSRPSRQRTAATTLASMSRCLPAAA